MNFVLNFLSKFKIFGGYLNPNFCFNLVLMCKTVSIHEYNSSNCDLSEGQIKDFENSQIFQVDPVTFDKYSSNSTVTEDILFEKSSVACLSSNTSTITIEETLYDDSMLNSIEELQMEYLKAAIQFQQQNQQQDQNLRRDQQQFFNNNVNNNINKISSYNYSLPNYNITNIPLSNYGFSNNNSISNNRIINDHQSNSNEILASVIFDSSLPKVSSIQNNNVNRNVQDLNVSEEDVIRYIGEAIFSEQDWNTYFPGKSKPFSANYKKISHVKPNSPLRCNEVGCTNIAQTKGKCKGHGGGNRCKFSGCIKSSQSGGLCRSHGGGKKCAIPDCYKGAQRDGVCSTHGGIRKCSISLCGKNDRGGGFCAEHGGGKRCKVANCVKPCRRQGLCTSHGRGGSEDIHQTVSA